MSTYGCPTRGSALAAATLLTATALVACAPTQPRGDSPSPSSRQPQVSDAEPAPLPSAVRATPQILGEEPWRFMTSPGLVLRTSHYRVFTTSKDPVLRERLVSFLEHSLATYRTTLGLLPAPPSRLDTYLLDNRTQWEAMTKQLMADQADLLLRIPRGGFASRGIGVYYDIGLYDSLAIAAHEGWHQYTQRTFSEALPVWLEEGIATYMEGHRWINGRPTFTPWANVERFDQLRAAVESGSLHPLDELLGASPTGFLGAGDERVLTFYAQLWAFTHFLLEGEGGVHAPALRRVVLDAAEGRLRATVAARLGEREADASLLQRSGPAVALAYFGGDLGKMGEAYMAFCERVAARGSRDRIVEGRSPLADQPAAGSR